MNRRSWGGVLLILMVAAGTAAAATGSFVDDDHSVHQADIEALAAAGITRGCNPPTNDRFCPEEPVTRAQMASFLARALHLPPNPHQPFSDAAASIHDPDISSLAAAGITRGCNPPTNDRFCPEEPVTRAQMASFLVRAGLVEGEVVVVSVDGVDYVFPSAVCLAGGEDVELLRAAVATAGEEARQRALGEYSGWPTTTISPEPTTALRDSTVRALAMATVAQLEDVVVAWWQAWEPYHFGTGDTPFTDRVSAWAVRVGPVVEAVGQACG